MKQYSKHILQYGQWGHSDLETNPVCRHVYTKKRHTARRKNVNEISTLLVFPTWFSFHSRCCNICTLFGNKNGEFCKLIRVMGVCKLKSYESMRKIHSSYYLFSNLHTGENKQGIFLTFILKCLSMFLLTKWCKFSKLTYHEKLQMVF